MTEIPAVLGDLRLQQIKNFAPDQSALSQFDYQFDADGEISNWTRQLGTQYAFGYDALGQLTHAMQTSGGNTLGKADYSYDDAGNRVSTQVGDSLTHTLSPTRPTRPYRPRAAVRSGSPAN